MSVRKTKDARRASRPLEDMRRLAKQLILDEVWEVTEREISGKKMGLLITAWPLEDGSWRVWVKYLDFASALPDPTVTRSGRHLCTAFAKARGALMEAMGKHELRVAEDVADLARRLCWVPPSR